VPEGERILVVSEPAINAAQANYLMFLDGGRHEWDELQLDQEYCVPRPNIQTKCDPEQNAISRIPAGAVWVQMVGGCKAISLSMPNLLGQLRRNDSAYVMTSSNHVFPSILELPSALQESNAFEIVHAELDERGRSGGNQGVVLVRNTGRAPRSMPTQMNPYTVRSLERCAEASGPGYAERIWSKFPNGIMGPDDILRGSE
jgi:hypothetical protein